MVDKFWKNSLIAFLAVGMVVGSPLWARHGDESQGKGGNRVRCNKNKVAGAFITPVVEEVFIDAETGDFLGTAQNRERLLLHRDGTASINFNAYSNAVDDNGNLVYLAERTSFNVSPRTGSWECVGIRKIRLHTHSEFNSNSNPFGDPAPQGGPLSTLLYTFNVAEVTVYSFDRAYNTLTPTTDDAESITAIYTLDQDVNDPTEVPTLRIEEAPDPKEIFNRVKNFIPPSS